jgi:hypothetical protein
MRWQAVLLSVIAALALPVVGLITGRVVGDFFLRGDLTGALGAGFGVLVYALALASSYSHLRHYYRGYEAQGVRASWALALAVEVATFYMSFSYVVIRSPWAFWGSLIGAFVVFWGNLSSMYEARLERAGSDEARAQFVPHDSERSPYLEALLSAETVETTVKQAVRAVSRIASPNSDGSLQDGREAVILPPQDNHEPPPERQDELPLSEVDQELLRLAAAGPVGPSSVSRALGIAKSSAGDRLRRLERMGLLVKQGSSYRLPEG